MNRLAWLLLAACAGPTGDLSVLIEGEDSITHGIDPGTELEDIVDGWTVRFSRYLVAAGDVRLTRGDEEIASERVLVVDLSAGSAELATIDAVPVDRWDFAWSMRAVDAERHESARQDDFDEMIANDWTYLIEGTLSDGARTISFRLGVPVPVRFGPCEAEDGLPGATITEGGTTVAVTLHGDHLFFDAFPSGAEVIERRAGWLAGSDLDGDGAITQAELEASEAGLLFPSDTYNLAGAPIPIENGWDFVRAQLTTQGHFQGEGECPWSITRE